MRQEGSRTVAPLNEEPRWPEGYLAVLREAGAIEKQLPYYVAWVRRFFARYPGRRRRDLGRAEIEAFLLASSREKGITNWRLAQGRAALELYYERFRGIGLAPRVSEGAEQGGNSRGERSEVRFQRSGNSRGEKGGGSAALSTPAQGRWMGGRTRAGGAKVFWGVFAAFALKGREGAGGGEFSQRLEAELGDAMRSWTLAPESFTSNVNAAPFSPISDHVVRSSHVLPLYFCNFTLRLAPPAAMFIVTVPTVLRAGNAKMPAVACNCTRPTEPTPLAAAAGATMHWVMLTVPAGMLCVQAP
jgi:hypothetical protein